MFHVEHSPIEEPASFAGPAFDEPMAIRPYRLDREDFRHGRSAGWSAIDPSLEPPVGERHAESPQADPVVHIPVNRQTRLTVLDQRPSLSCPERPPTTEQEHGL